MSTTILLWVLLQAGAVPRVPSSHMDAAARLKNPDFAEEAPSVDYAAAEEREFIQRLNGLSRALSDFAETYRSGQVDPKKVKALQKAMHEFEKSDWFRPPKSK